MAKHPLTALGHPQLLRRACDPAAPLKAFQIRGGADGAQPLRRGPEGGDGGEGQ